MTTKKHGVLSDRSCSILIGENEPIDYKRHRSHEFFFVHRQETATTATAPTATNAANTTTCNKHYQRAYSMEYLTEGAHGAKELNSEEFEMVVRTLEQESNYQREKPSKSD
ncbi:hypothetical protein KIN20_012965 [Parelaphostrongylus tenuis]|uniref:Uncharacterized protein n=1 Tax=Parelaphostrongylus tenuis TaxID=148309 RepID=A0AAD5QN59_PARTN|nr:hypothetical protein KIN20_012965 [Parelaphostrongylus tenuis]